VHSPALYVVVFDISRSFVRRQGFELTGGPTRDEFPVQRLSCVPLTLLTCVLPPPCFVCRGVIGHARVCVGGASCVLCARSPVNVRLRGERSSRASRVFVVVRRALSLLTLIYVRDVGW
jgi:hypothetical protein